MMLTCITVFVVGVVDIVLSVIVGAFTTVGVVDIIGVVDWVGRVNQLVYHQEK